MVVLLVTTATDVPYTAGVVSTADERLQGTGVTQSVLLVVQIVACLSAGLGTSRRSVLVEALIMR